MLTYCARCELCELGDLEIEHLNFDATVSSRQSNSGDAGPQSFVTKSLPLLSASSSSPDLSRKSRHEEKDVNVDVQPTKKLRRATNTVAEGVSKSCHPGKETTIKIKSKSRRPRQTGNNELLVVQNREFGVSTYDDDPYFDTEDPISSDEVQNNLRPQKQLAKRRTRAKHKPLSVLQHDILRNSSQGDNNIDLSEFRIPKKNPSITGATRWSSFMTNSPDGFEGAEALPTGITMSVRQKALDRRFSKPRPQCIIGQLPMVTSRLFGDEVVMSEMGLGTNIPPMKAYGTPTISKVLCTESSGDIPQKQIGQTEDEEVAVGDNKYYTLESPKVPISPGCPQCQDTLSRTSNLTEPKAPMRKVRFNQSVEILQQLTMVSAPAPTVAGDDSCNSDLESGEDD